jgi:hypothetical protein
MRTLVIGIPLPDASFDNYSFVSAPSLSDYSRLIVDMESVSRTVEEVVNAAVEHRTFAGQAVRNGAATTRTFALADLIAMRTREARRFFERGGTAVLFTHPDVAVSGVEGAPAFRRYGWLPERHGFAYRTHLLPCFGKEPVTAGEGDHPFFGFINEFESRFSYQVCADEDALTSAAGRVIARSPGGDAVAFDLPVLGGAMTFVPPVRDYRDQRQRIADTLLQGFEATSMNSPTDIPEWIRKEVP